jgi:hypothetical protein
VTALAARRAARVPAAAGAARWHRPALAVLLAATAALYLAGLSRNGWANDFYAAAVQAGSKSWKAFFFGSSDASNFITADKTPGSLWVMELSARLFGLNYYWSVLVPQGKAWPPSRCCMRRCGAGPDRAPGCWPGRCSR